MTGHERMQTDQTSVSSTLFFVFPQVSTIIVMLHPIYRKILYNISSSNLSAVVLPIFNSILYIILFISKFSTIYLALFALIIDMTTFEAYTYYRISLDPISLPRKCDTTDSRLET